VSGSAPAGRFGPRTGERMRLDEVPAPQEEADRLATTGQSDGT
jgi:hypothetical protein